VKSSISIVKPGIIFGNIITLIGGFFLGSSGFNPLLLLLAMIGMSLVIAAGCIFNNIIDRDIDRLMERTQKRALVVGLISEKKAFWYGVLSAIAGFLVLYFLVNPLTCLMALIGLVVYVGTYSLWMKRKSIHGTTVGGIAGAIPPVVGYCAATNRFDLGAVLVFLILFFWQLPHFYAITIYRLKDFNAASLPVLPAVKGMAHTKKSLRYFIVAFTISAILPVIFGYEGFLYGFIALCLGASWLYFAYQKIIDERVWARKLFLYSIIVITVLCFAMGL